jgi:hypothetical protein
VIVTQSGGFPTYFRFDNNIVIGPLRLSGNIGKCPVTSCRNNTFEWQNASGNLLQFFCNDFTNNILKSTNVTVDIQSGNPLSYNVSASATGQFGTANNNIVLGTAALMSNYFVAPDANPSDNDYQFRTPLMLHKQAQMVPSGVLLEVIP